MKIWQFVVLYFFIGLCAWWVIWEIKRFIIGTLVTLEHRLTDVHKEIENIKEDVKELDTFIRVDLFQKKI